MPISHRVDRGLGCVFTTAAGELTDQELLDHAQRVESDGDVDPRFDEVVDLRAVTGFGPSTPTVRETAQLLKTGKRREKQGRLAIVAPSNAGFGVGRMFEALSGSDAERVQTFRTLPEALDWLGVAAPPDGAESDDAS
jgi:hypothetical protein